MASLVSSASSIPTPAALVGFVDQRLPDSDQTVKLTTVDPPAMVRIVGITPDHGLLRTIPESRNYRSNRGDEYIDLQPDGNSFDLMAGLIKTKS